MKLSQSEKSGIKQLLSSLHWKTVETIAEQIISRIREEEGIKDSEWETVKNAIDKESQVKGIRRLFQELWFQTNDNE